MRIPAGASLNWFLPVFPCTHLEPQQRSPSEETMSSSSPERYKQVPKTTNGPVAPFSSWCRMVSLTDWLELCLRDSLLSVEVAADQLHLHKSPSKRPCKGLFKMLSNCPEIYIYFFYTCCKRVTTCAQCPGPPEGKLGLLSKCRSKIRRILLGRILQPLHSRKAGVCCLQEIMG